MTIDEKICILQQKIITKISAKYATMYEAGNVIGYRIPT